MNQASDLFCVAVMIDSRPDYAIAERSHQSTLVIRSILVKRSILICGFAAFRAESLRLSGHPYQNYRLRLPSGIAAKRVGRSTESRRLSAREAAKPQKLLDTYRNRSSTYRNRSRTPIEKKKVPLASPGPRLVFHA